MRPDDASGPRDREESRSSREKPVVRESEAREHLANERTLLAWVRTGVGLISVGVVVERAGAVTRLATASSAASEAFGLALAFLGALALILGSVRFLKTRRRILANEFDPSVGIYLIIVSGSIALAGAFIIYTLAT